jgi:hypothetical protein
MEAVVRNQRLVRMPFRRGIIRSNENKMSDGGRGRASFGVEMWKSSQSRSVQRSAVRSIAWLDGGVASRCRSRSRLQKGQEEMSFLNDHPEAPIPPSDFLQRGQRNPNPFTYTPTISNIAIAPIKRQFGRTLYPRAHSTSAKAIAMSHGMPTPMRKRRFS